MSGNLKLKPVLFVVFILSAHTLRNIYKKKREQRRVNPLQHHFSSKKKSDHDTKRFISLLNISLDSHCCGGLLSLIHIILTNKASWCYIFIIITQARIKKQSDLRFVVIYFSLVRFLEMGSKKGVHVPFLMYSNSELWMKTLQSFANIHLLW